MPLSLLLELPWLMEQPGCGGGCIGYLRQPKLLVMASERKLIMYLRLDTSVVIN